MYLCKKPWPNTFSGQCFVLWNVNDFLFILSILVSIMWQSSVREKINMCEGMSNEVKTIFHWDTYPINQLKISTASFLTTLYLKKDYKSEYWKKESYCISRRINIHLMIYSVYHQQIQHVVVTLLRRFWNPSTGTRLQLFCTSSLFYKNHYLLFV